MESAEDFYLLRITDAGMASDGRHPFDYPPSQFLDGDARSAFARYTETSAYTGAPRYIKVVKPPEPEPQTVDLARGVGLVEQILDEEELLLALSERHYTVFADKFDPALEELHPVRLYRSPGHRSGKVQSKSYRIGTIAHRDVIANWVDFATSTFDLVDFNGFHRHGTQAMRGEVAFGSAYPVLETDCRFADLAEYKARSREAINDLSALVPRRLGMRWGEVPILFHLDHGQILVHAALAGTLTGYSKPGTLCPFPPVQVHTVGA